MLVFVIALKSSQVSRSWEQVSKLFERCLKSICNQTSDKFRVIVVCHEKPEIEFQHPHVTYIEVNFPIPSDVQSKLLDRTRKQFTGLNYAKKLNPSHLMFVDADDCISKNLAKFVEQYPKQNGWFIDRGYVYQEGKNSIFYKRKDFHLWCGTSNILRQDLHTYVESTESDEINYSQFYTGHQDIAKIMKRDRTPLEPLPFPGAVYTISHQDNLSDEQLNPGNRESLLQPTNPLSLGKKVLLNYRYATKSIRDEFSLYKLN